MKNLHPYLQIKISRKKGKIKNIYFIDIVFEKKKGLWWS